MILDILIRNIVIHITGGMKIMKKIEDMQASMHKMPWGIRTTK